MSALAHTLNITEERSSVTSISVTARIDYILRFAKQAVLVVDDIPSHFIEVGSQFIGSLSDEHNTAFVTISSKLNQIQIRCRIIEQLFGNILFDPEQSLAVSVINQSKSASEAISIVIEHAQLLSLQLLHELCQLAEIAKKTNKRINVLLLGTSQTGKLIAINRSIFENKISIISAQTGQQISISSKIFRGKNTFSLSNKSLKFVLGLLMFFGVLITALVLIQQRELLSFMPIAQNSGKEQLVLNEQIDKNNENSSLKKENINIINVKMASSEEVFRSIFETPKIQTPTNKDMKAIKASKPINKPYIASKDMLENSTTKIVEVESAIIIPREPILATVVNNKNINIDPAYYNKFNSGFVIQLAGFTQNSVFNEFIENHETLEYVGYYRTLNQEKYLVITSKVFKTKTLAEKEILSLSNEFLKRGPWIKTIEAVNTEINQYQQNQ